MPTLFSDLAYAALRIAGVVDRARRNPALEIQNELVEIFNRMVGSWSTIKLNIFSEKIETFSLTANQQTNTIGPSGQFNTTRPEKLTRVNLFITTAPTTVRRGVNLLEPAQWQEKRVQNVLGPPLDVYDDYASPLSTLYWWPIPDKIYTVEFFSWLQVPTVTAPGNLLNLPPGYDEAVTYNLAKHVSAQFPRQSNMSQLALDIARTSLSNIQSRNTASPRLTNDAGRLGHDRGPRGDFNWLTAGPI